MPSPETKQPRSVAQWAALAQLGDEARQLAASASDLRSFAGTLAREGHGADAVRLLAHLLPGREGVLWAWSCAKAVAPDNPPAAWSRSLATTENWIAQPNDENRRAAMAAAQEAEMGTAAGAAGLAAFLSGESLAPANAQPVPPAEFLAAKAIAASVMLSAIAVQPENASTKYSDFLMRGFAVAQRIQLWERITDQPGKDGL